MGARFSSLFEPEHLTNTMRFQLTLATILMALGHTRANCNVATTPTGITAHSDEFRLYTLYDTSIIVKPFNTIPKLIHKIQGSENFNNFTSVVYDGKDVYYLHGQGACYLNESLGLNCSQNPFKVMIDYTKYGLTPLAATQFRDGPFFFSLGPLASSSAQNIAQITYDKETNLVTRRKLDSSYNKNNTPSAIQWLRSEGNLDILLVFFQDIVGIHKVNLLDFQYPVLIDAENINYRSSGDWLGCEPVFCFDASVDGATRGTNGTLNLHHGAYIWSIDGKKVSTFKFLLSNLDAALHHKGVAYYFKDGGIARTGIGFGLEPLSKYFRNRKQPVEAAFYYNELTWLISNGTYVAYQFSNSIFTEYSGANYSIFQGLPRTIDGAAVYKGMVHFFSDNFYYVRNDKGHKDDTLLTQGLVKSGCNSKYYQQSNQAKLLGIRSKKQFQTYRLQFKPKVETQETEMAPPKQQMFLIVLVAVLLLAVIGLLIFRTFKTVDFNWKTNSLQTNTITQVTDYSSQDKREPRVEEPGESKSDTK
ncbi:hypothetical protein HDE_07856 [Halotydeus destructor]|nr:hypothetical protein HDE_07856 [Halotydeus destructor]